MKALITPFLLCACTGLIAQPTFTSAYFNHPFGQVMDVRSCDYAEPGAATNGFTLDLSTIAIGNKVNVQVVDPASTQYASDFPNATYATLSDGGAYGFAQITSNGEMNLGVEGGGV